MVDVDNGEVLGLLSMLYLINELHLESEDFELDSKWVF
jgi:hypothetical protein